MTKAGTQMNADKAQMNVNLPWEVRGPASMARKFRRWGTFICVGSAFICVPGLVHAQLFKCVQGGKTVYQQEKCPEEARQSTVRPPDTVPVKPLDPQAAAEKAEKEQVAEKGNVIGVFASYTVCAEKFPEFATRYSGAFDDWKKRNAAAFSRVTSSPEGGKELNDRLRAERAKPFPEDTPGRLAACAPTVSAIQPGRGTK